MGHFLDRRRHNPANPRVLGADLGQVAWGTGGLFGTAFLNDKAVAPVLRNVVPGVYGHDLAGKLVDAGTTLGVAWVAGEIVSRASAAGGRMVQLAGSFLAGARALSALVPGFQLSATVPQSLSLSFPTGGGTKQVNGAQAAPALPAGETVALYQQSISPMAPASQAYSLKGGM